MAPLRGSRRKRKVEENDEENLLVSGSSKEGSDESWEVLAKKIAGNPSLSSQGIDHCKSTFRMSKRTFDYLCLLVKDHMMGKGNFSFTNGNRASITDLVALALRRLGSGNSLISIGGSFGMHHSNVSQVTWRFVEAIEETGLHHLKWPSTEQEVSSIKSKFESIRGFPNCCGAIDTMHIMMQLTASDQEANHWLDGAGNHSMILQAIVDSDLKFRDIVTGWPGKMNDSSVLQNSSFYQHCQKGDKLNGSTIPLSKSFELREYIIGDSGFPLLPWLVTPYQGQRLTKAKVEFNERLVNTHLVAQKAMARLKEDWRIIKGKVWRPDKHRLPRLILACCILHNIVIDMEDGKEDIDELSSGSGGIQHDPNYEQEVCDYVDQSGSSLRNKLNRYFCGAP